MLLYKKNKYIKKYLYTKRIKLILLKIFSLKSIYLIKNIVN